jgi:hypothetical protein
VTRGLTLMFMTVEALKPRYLTIKGKRMVVLPQGDFEELFARLTFGSRSCPKPVSAVFIPSPFWRLSKPATFYAPAASWACRKPSSPARPASARKRSIVSNRAGTNRACPPLPRLTGPQERSSSVPVTVQYGGAFHPLQEVAMPPTIQELGLDRLSPEDRLAVAEAIWDSVARETEAAPRGRSSRPEPWRGRGSEATNRPEGRGPGRIRRGVRLVRRQEGGPRPGSAIGSSSIRGLAAVGDGRHSPRSPEQN